MLRCAKRSTPAEVLHDPSLLKTSRPQSQVLQARAKTMVDVMVNVGCPTSPRLKSRKINHCSVTFICFVALQVIGFGGFYHMLYRSKTDDLKRTLKHAEQRQPTDWETCMASSSMPVDDTREQVFLSFPPKRNITLEEAFLSDKTTIYFLHQRKNAGSSLSRILMDMYAELIADAVVDHYNATHEIYGLKKGNRISKKGKEPFSIEKYAKEIGNKEALKRTFAPCIASYHCSHDELRVRENYSGRMKVIVGRHMTYHIPFARSIYEDQVLITNFRSPPKRVESCIKYRFADLSLEVLDTDDFDINEAERILLTAKDDASGSSCMGEAFRILTPFDPDQPVEPADVQKVCCYVKTGFHIIDVTQPEREMTLIEADLHEKLKHKESNKNRDRYSDRYQRNMATLIEHITANNPVLQSEMQLYDCIHDGQ